MPTAHGGVDGGRSQGGVEADDNRGTTDRDEADGSTGADGEPMEMREFAGNGDQGDAAVTIVEGG